MEEIDPYGDVGDFVAFESSGTPGKGQYRCAGCGYGITIHDELPTCPMCGGTSWEAALWTPFRNAGGFAHGLSASL